MVLNFESISASSLERKILAALQDRPLTIAELLKYFYDKYSIPDTYAKSNFRQRIYSRCCKLIKTKEIKVTTITTTNSKNCSSETNLYHLNNIE